MPVLIDSTKFDEYKQTLPVNEQQKFYRLGARAWDIALARYLAEQSKADCSYINVTEWAAAMGFDKPLGAKNLMFPVNDKYALALSKEQLQRPVIVAVVKFGEEKTADQILIDGTHRLRAAFLRGIIELPCYILNQKQARKCEVRL